jgi:hypothetical protein
VCGKHKHRSYQCWYRKEANDVNNNLIAMVTKANHVTSESVWWLDTRVTVHISKDISLFKTYKVIDDGTAVKMCNNIQTKVLEKKNHRHCQKLATPFTNGQRAHDVDPPLHK